MRWFKHLSRSHLDTSLCRLMDEFGLEGYGAYWLLLEAIAEQCDDSDNVTISMSPQNWRKVLPFYPQRLAKFAQCLGNLQLFSVEISNSLITISCPKLLKYRDEYTERKSKKSGVCRDKVLPRSDIDQNRSKQKKEILFAGGSEPLRLAEYFYELILANNPKFTKPNMQAWAKHVDLLMRKDGRTSEEITAVMEWVQSDTTPRNGFCWAVNVLSTEKLRKQFSQLEMKMPGGSAGGYDWRGVL